MQKYEFLGWRQTKNRNPLLTERDERKYVTVIRSKTATANPKMMKAEEEFLRLERKIHPSFFRKLLFFLFIVICLFLLASYFSFAIGFPSNVVTDFLAMVAKYCDLLHFLSLTEMQASIVDSFITLVALFIGCIVHFVKKSRARKKEEDLLKDSEIELFMMKCKYRDQKIDRVRNEMQDIGSIRLP